MLGLGLARGWASPSPSPSILDAPTNCHMQGEEGPPGGHPHLSAPCLWTSRGNQPPGPTGRPRPHLSPELPTGRAEPAPPSAGRVLLTAPQVGGHVLQHLDLSDGLPPGEVHHEHPVARGEVLQAAGRGQELPGRNQGSPGKTQSAGPPAASAVSSGPEALGSQRDPQAAAWLPPAFYLPVPLTPPVIRACAERFTETATTACGLPERERTLPLPREGEQKAPKARAMALAAARGPGGALWCPRLRQSGRRLTRTAGRGPSARTAAAGPCRGSGWQGSHPHTQPGSSAAEGGKETNPKLATPYREGCEVLELRRLLRKPVQRGTRGGRQRPPHGLRCCPSCTGGSETPRLPLPWPRPPRALRKHSARRHPARRSWSTCSPPVAPAFGPGPPSSTTPGPTRNAVYVNEPPCPV